jgi:hypothetical protein
MEILKMNNIEAFLFGLLAAVGLITLFSLGV